MYESEVVCLLNIHCNNINIAMYTADNKTIIDVDFDYENRALQSVVERLGSRGGFESTSSLKVILNLFVLCTTHWSD